MSLRIRLLLAVGLTLVGLVFGIYLVAARLMMHSFESIERNDASENLMRAKRGFSQTIDDIYTKAGDWSTWDDTYEFMADHNAKYVKSNLLPSAVSMLKLDVIMFVDTEGKVFHALPIRRDHALEAPHPGEILAALDLQQLQSNPAVSSRGASGLILLPHDSMMVAVRPVLTSDEKGPSRGWVVFGRRLGDPEIADLRALTHLNIGMARLDDPALQDSDQLNVAAGEASKKDFVEPLDERTIAAYSTVKDLWGEPALLLSIQKPRTIYQQGLDTVSLARTLILVAGAILGAVILLVLERSALARLSRLSMEVEKIGSGASAVSVSGRDELTRLAKRINQMLAQLRAGEEQLRVHNDNLELTVQERTQQIEHQAFHDKLTGLPNRALFMDRIAFALSKSSRTNSGTATMFLDLDNFKLVNDSLGHGVGDSLLIAVADRLNEAIRPGDTVARMGGDEFTVLLEDLHNVEEAEMIGKRILQILRRPIQLMNREAFASASIGIAFTSDSFIAPEALLKNADTAMYRAKANGKANSVVWNESMNDHAIERLELETDLRRALDNREIYVDYQPLVDLTTGSLEGAEALARWKHPTRGIVPPGMFIPIAEDAGMIISIGYWILEEACLQAVEWQQSFGLKEFTMSVNLSGKQLQAPDVVERVADTLERTGLLATSLKLEITESVLMANREDVVAKMNRLRALGVRLALDDFGTGYSSLSTLSMFPIDTLKIDRAFISRLGDEDEAMAVVEAIMAMSRSMKMDVTGEGVETEYQMNVLRALGCHTGQGYLFAKPLSVSDFSEQLSDRGRRALRVGKPGKSKPDKKAA